MVTYRDRFEDPDEAARYDVEGYGSRSWSSLLWEVEQDILTLLMRTPSFVPTRERYLDFACGTGRIAGFIAPYFSRSYGIDTSEAMLARARQAVDGVTFTAADVSVGVGLVEGPFDLVSAFRFMLNAERQDVVAALQWICSQLRDQYSRVVLNNHGNLWTHKALPHMLRTARDCVGDRVTGNVLSHRAAQRLCTEAGFRVEKVIGYGLYGGRGIAVVGYERYLSMQRRLAGSQGIQRLGESQLYVLAPA